MGIKIRFTVTDTSKVSYYCQGITVGGKHKHYKIMFVCLSQNNQRQNPAHNKPALFGHVPDKAGFLHDLETSIV
jgi:hypothetical protein